MATAGHAPTASEYIVHHLTQLNTSGHAQQNVIDWSILNIDTLFYSVLIGAISLYFLWRAASKATSGVPGRFQAAVELLVEMVADQAKGIVGRAKLDDNKELAKFASTLEEVCVATVESGFMTKDLALLIGPDQPWLSTTGFLDKIDENLQKAMAA